MPHNILKTIEIREKMMEGRQTNTFFGARLGPRIKGSTSKNQWGRKLNKRIGPTAERTDGGTGQHIMRGGLRPLLTRLWRALWHPPLCGGSIMCRPMPPSVFQPLAPICFSDFAPIHLKTSVRVVFRAVCSVGFLVYWADDI